MFFKKDTVKISKKLIEAAYKFNDRKMSFTVPVKDGHYILDCNIRKVNKIFGTKKEKQS